MMDLRLLASNWPEPWLHEGAEKLERDWRNASAVVGKKDLIVDLSFLTEIDPGGRQLLLRLLKNGATVVANTPESRALAESILGRTLLQLPGSHIPGGRTGRDRSSRRSSDYWIAGTADLCERLSADSSDWFNPQPLLRALPSLGISPWLQARDPFAESGPVALAIVASLPGLDKQGSLLAIREVGESEREEYGKVLLHGDSAVFERVIASYFLAQRQTEELPLSSVIITPQN